MAGRYKAYPEYDSCESFPPASKPTHWVGMQVRHALRSASSSGSAIKGTVSSEPADHLFPAYSASGQDVWTVDWIYNEPGIVLSAVGARCGKTFRADGKWSVVANTGVFLLRSKMDRDFFWYVTNNEIFWEKGGSAQPYVQVPSTLAKRIGVPSLPEQKQIAKFLDHETGRIDALIEKQQALIALLQEKRQAVISHAVTKGLNSDATMKDSGIEWLGEVPEHWEVASLSMIFNIKAGGDLKAHYFSEERTEAHPYPIYTNANDEGAVYGYTSKACYPPNSVTVSGRGEVGFAVFRDHAYDAIIRLLVLTPIDQANGRFFAYVINEVIDFNAESSAIGQLSTQQIAPYRVDFPAIEEQTKIVEYLDLQTAKMDHLVKKAHGAIALMQERRTALISAAVTGKIDVRDWEPAPEA